MSRSHSEYEEIAVIRDPDGLGLIAPITRRKKPDGYHAFTFAIMKEFERKQGGPVERSSFLNERHAAAIIKLVDLVMQRIQTEKDKLFVVRREGGSL